jgi:hypothetical protein
MCPQRNLPPHDPVPLQRCRRHCHLSTVLHWDKQVPTLQHGVQHCMQAPDSDTVTIMIGAFQREHYDRQTLPRPLHDVSMLWSKNHVVPCCTLVFVTLKAPTPALLLTTTTTASVAVLPGPAAVPTTPLWHNQMEGACHDPRATSSDLSDITRYLVISMCTPKHHAGGGGLTSVVDQNHALAALLQRSAHEVPKLDQRWRNA